VYFWYALFHLRAFDRSIPKFQLVFSYSEGKNVHYLFSNRRQSDVGKNLKIGPGTCKILFFYYMEDSTFFLEEIAIIAYSSIKQSVLG
jgi:hypothetical protein